MPLTLKKHLTRRNAIIAAGGAGTLVATTALISGNGGKSTLVGKIDPTQIKALGDGFYLANGWVLSAEDLKGFDLSNAQPDVKTDVKPGAISEQ